MKMLRYIGLICGVVLVTACSDMAADKPFASASDLRQVLAANRILVTLQFSAPPTIKQRATGRLTTINLGLPTNVLNAVGEVQLTNDANPSGFGPGKTIVTWIVTDQSGNTGTALQLVIITTESCASFEPRFQQSVWPVLNRDCLNCHRLNGTITPLNFFYSTTNGSANANFRAFKNSVAKTDINGESLLLNKTSNSNGDHVGGKIFSVNSPEYGVLEDLTRKLEVCYDDDLALENLVLADPYKRWRKTTLALTGRLPLTAEENAISAASNELQLERVVDELLDGLLEEDAFYTHLKEFYNDLLLTNAFEPDTKALMLRFDNFTNKDYYADKILNQNGYDVSATRTLRRNVSIGISQAPLELIAYVVKQNLPFTEILTANYVMVNAYSATLYGANVTNDPAFNFQYGDDFQSIDASVFKPATTSDRYGRVIPHAGVLSTLAFLSRYPSTRLDRNRERARYVFLYFLDVDIEGLADRAGLDLNNQRGQFPTLEDPQCNICHDVMDPVAGLFKNWDDFGRYRGDFQVWPNVRNPPQMLPPAYSIAANISLPEESGDTALRWLAQQIAIDNRFALATVHMIYKSLTGQYPGNDTLFFDQLKQQFVNSNYNLKVLIKAVINSYYFRVENALVAAGSVDPLQQEYGMGHLLSPEQLHRKIIAVTGGYAWRSPTGKDLLDVKTNRLIYGGIDGNSVTQRNPNPNGLTAGLQSRIALQLSCEIVPLDFSKPANQRTLFPFVEITDLPDNGVRQQRMIENIQYLFKHVLGETVSMPSTEVDKVLELFIVARNSMASTSVSRECRGSLSAEDPMVLDRMKTVRPWMAVLAYFFLDYRFYFE